MINIAGIVQFDDVKVNVYNSLDDPLFKISDLTDAFIDMTEEEMLDALELCETDELVVLPKTIEDDAFSCIYVTESGLYNILAQSRKPIARKWRRIIIKELISLRRSRNYNIIEQFDEWDHQLDDLYFDEETGTLMSSVLTQGGDVFQVSYELDENEDNDD